MAKVELDLTSQLIAGNISHGLQELVAYYSNRLSYQEVEDLVTRISGEQRSCGAARAGKACR